MIVESTKLRTVHKLTIKCPEKKERGHGRNGKKRDDHKRIIREIER